MDDKVHPLFLVFLCVHNLILWKKLALFFILLYLCTVRKVKYPLFARRFKTLLSERYFFDLF